MRHLDESVGSDEDFPTHYCAMQVNHRLPRGGGLPRVVIVETVHLRPVYESRISSPLPAGAVRVYQDPTEAGWIAI